MDFTAPKIGVDPEKALRAFAEGVGMSVDAMWKGWTREVVAEVPGVPHIMWEERSWRLTGATKP